MTKLFSTCLSDQMTERDQGCRKEQRGGEGATRTAENPTRFMGFRLRQLNGSLATLGPIFCSKNQTNQNLMVRI